MKPFIVPMGTRANSQTSRRGLFGRGAEVATSALLGATGSVTCCNCDCQGIDLCDCASDYHGEPANCPKK